MKRISFLLAGTAALFCQAAFAADLAVKAAPLQAAYNWSGFYAGLNAGYGWASGKQNYTGDAASNGGGTSGAGNLVLNVLQNFVLFPAAFADNPLSIGNSSAGFVGGGQIGYNWQFNPRWVAGIETDFQYSDLKENTFFSAQPPGGVTYGLTSNDRLQWFGTTRARLGYLPAERLLIFATAGIAYGKTDAAASIANTSAMGHNIAALTPGLICPASAVCLAGSNSATSVGWAAGAGGEYAATNAVSLKLEYLHVDLGSQSFAMVAQAPATGAGFVTAKFGNTYDIVRAGVNVKFGGL